MLSLKDEFEMSEEYKLAFAEFKKRRGNDRWAKGLLQPFIKDTFVESKGGRVRASRMKGLYDEWADKKGATPYSMRKLGEGLKSLLESRRMSDGVYYFGIEEVGDNHDLYRIYDVETGKSDNVDRVMESVLSFTKDLWKYINKGVVGMPDEPDHIDESNVSEELQKLGFRFEKVKEAGKGE